MINKRKMELKSQSGITIMALIVTIIIMLILAAISLNAAFGNGGILSRAQEAKEMHEESEYQEEQDQLYVEEKVLDREKYYYVEEEDNQYEVERLNINEIIDPVDVDHPHVFKTNNDTNQHWEECIACGLRRSVANHNLTLVGNGPTCDVYVTLGRYVCTGCGYERPVERLAHIWPAHPSWYDWNGHVHMHNGCQRCHGGGSNNYNAYHRFNYNGQVKTFAELKSMGFNFHAASPMKCIDCNITPNWRIHNVYGNNCYLCGRVAGTAGRTPNKNTMKNGNVMLDLVNKTVDYYYWDVYDDFPGNTHVPGSVHASSLYGGNYQIVSKELLNKQGNTYHYRIGVSLIDRSKQITESMRLYCYGGFQSYRTHDSGDMVMVDSTPPVISSVTCSPQTSVNGWTTINQITVTGTEKSCAVVYISMYDPSGRVVFTNQSCQVASNGTYSFKITPEVEAVGSQQFTVKVKDFCGNEASKAVTLTKIDSKPPKLAPGQVTQFMGSDDNWVRYHQIEIKAVDEGAGEVQFAFNDPATKVKYQEKNGTTFSYKYRCYGDVYGSDVKGLIVYLEDGVGNNEVYGFKFGHIDSTEPTITAVNKSGNKYTIVANDLNRKLNKSGSGVVGYAYSSYKDWYNNIDYQSSPEFTITKRGTYYAFAKDKAGNFSEGYEFRVE